MEAVERGGSSHVVICDLMRRYGCRTSSSSGREKVVDDRRQNTGEDIFFVWPSSLDYLPFDLLSIGNVTGRGALFPRPEIFVASFAGAGRLNERHVFFVIKIC